MENLNADTSVVFLIMAGNAFHSLNLPQNKLSKFFSDARCVKLTDVRILKPTTARKHRDSSSCVC